MLKYFLEKFTSIKGDYMNSSPKKKWMFILNLGIFVQKALGIAILDPKFEVWCYSYASGVAFLNYLLSLVYTLWYYSDIPSKGLLSTALLGITIPPIMVFAMIFDPTKRKALQSLVHFPGWTVYPDYFKETSHKYMMICDRSARKLLSSTIKTIVILLLSNGLFLASCVFAYIQYGEIQLAAPVLFPFTDLDSVNGLIINMLNQGFLGLTMIVGLIGIEIPTCILKDAIEMSTAAICYSVDEISEKIKDSNTYSKSCIDHYFRNILMQAQDLDRFILTLLRLFYYRLLFQPILLSIGISMALFFYLSGVWMAGAGAAFVSYTQLYIQCVYGEAMRTSNEVLLMKMHDMPWYLMSIKSQLDFAHLLNRLQNGAVFRMGPFDELNFETLSNMTKRIYTFLMMLIGMLN